MNAELIKMRERLLIHLLECDSTPDTLAKVLTGPQGKQHTATVIGALLMAEGVLPMLANTNVAQASADIHALCLAMAIQHGIAERKFDA